MRRNLLVICLLACAALLLSSSTVLAADAWLGSWNLNVAKSKAVPGPLPKSQTLMFEATPTGIKLSSETVDAEGKTTQGTYEAKFDGTDVSWQGNPDADTASPKRVNANSYINTWKMGGKVTIKAKVVVSANGKTLTVTQTGTNSKGQAVKNRYVFDRQ